MQQLEDYLQGDHLEGWEAGTASTAERPLLPPSTFPGLLSSSRAMLASLPAAPRANLYHSMSRIFSPLTQWTEPPSSD